MTSFNLSPAVHALYTDNGSWKSRLHQLKVSSLHGGIDPDFRAAIRDLYFRELRKQLNAIDRYESEVKERPLLARLQLLRAMRTQPFVRFSQSHWVELNDHHTELLQALYGRVGAVKALRKSVLTAKSSEAIQLSLEQLDRVPTFRLMHRLGTEGLKRSA